MTNPNIVHGPVYELGDIVTFGADPGPARFRHVGDAERRRRDQIVRQAEAERRARIAGKALAGLDRHRHLLAQTPAGRDALRAQGHGPAAIERFAREIPPAVPSSPPAPPVTFGSRDGLTPERRKQLLEASPLGKAILRDEERGHAPPAEKPLRPGETLYLAPNLVVDGRVHPDVIRRGKDGQS